MALHRMKAVLGRFRRRRSNAAMLSDYISLRKAVTLCGRCESQMPRGWLSRVVYRLLPSFHGAGACTRCQEDGPCNIYLPEEDVYMTSYAAGHRLQGRAVQQQRAVRDPYRRRSA